MGASAEGKISLSVELQNFKDIAGSLKKGLSEQLKQVPLDIEFNNKEIESKVTKAVKNINDILSKSRVKYLDLSSILPNFINEINKEGVSEEVREQMVKGFETALTNLRDIGIKQDYSKLKGFSGEQLKDYISDLNDVMDILNTIEGLNERQKQGLLTTVLPSLSDLKGRGKDAAKKEYTKGAKKLDAILKLSDDYGSVLQYGVNPTATITALNSLNKKVKSGEKLTKGEGQDLLGYLLRGKFLGIEFGKVGNKELENLDYDYLLQSAKESLDKATIEYIENKSTAYFAALDKIYNSSAQEISYSDLTKGIQNTTNQKMQNMYDAEVPENSTKKIRAGSITKRVIKLSSKEKPELRKRTQNEDEDTGETELQPQDTDEEKIIQDYKKQIEQIDNELRQIDDKLDKAQDKEIQLKKQLPVEENKLKEKEIDFQSFQNEHVKYTSSLENAEREKNALENTVASLNRQLEEEKTKRDEIKKTYDKLISEREEIKKNIEDGEKQLEKILPPLDEEINAFQGKLDEEQKGLDNEKAWINFYNAPLTQEYKFKNKKEAYGRLKQLGEKYREFRENPSSSKWTDKEAERMRFVVKHYKAWQAAKEIGIADSRLYNEQFDTDNDYEYQEAINYLQQHKQREEEIYKEIENEVQQLQDKINKLKQQKKQLNKQLSDDPQKAKEDNRKAIEKKEAELNSSDIGISKLEKQKQQSETELAQITQSIEQNQETDEDKIRYEERLKQLEEEKNIQKKIYNETKRKLQEAQQQQIDLDNRQVELNEKKDQLLEKQKQAEEKLEVKRKEEEQRKKEEAERAAQEDRERTKKEENTEKEQTEETKFEKNTTSTSDTSTPPSIPPEKLEEILTLLGNIQKALGTLEDGSDIPSITQSVKDMVDALKELNVALGDIKQKDFNLNIGLPSNNPIGQQGEAKRKILKELAQQYDELDSYFINKYGDDSSAFNALSKLEGGSNYVNTMMSDYSVIGDTNASLSDKIEVYKTLIEQLRSFLIQEGGDINNVLTNVLSPEEIINKITDDIAKFNPTTALQSIFEEMKISIDASLAQINTESKGFNFLSGSAEEAAEAKRKFVEANKEVLQSIVASMPKIEEEAKALEKVEEIKEESNKTSEAFEKDESNIEKQKKQAEEIARNKREVQEQYKNQFHAWDENGQLSFLDKNDYDLQNEYLELQKQEAEQLAKQAEQNPPKVNIPIEGQISFINLENKNIFDNMLPEDILSNYGDIVGEDLSKSITLSLEKNMTSIDSAGFADELFSKLYEEYANMADSIEARFAGLLKSKDFIQNEDISEKFLESYESISTEKTQKLFKTIQELKQVKASLQDSFDENGNLIGDPYQVTDIYNTYVKLIDIVKRLKLEITGQYSEETVALKLKQDAEKAQAEIEKAAQQTEKKLKALKENVDKTINKSDLFEAQTQKTINAYGAFDSNGQGQRGQLIKASQLSDDPNNRFVKQQEQVQELISKLDEYKTAIKELDNLRSSDNTTLEQLKEADDKVKKLKDSISTLSQTIRTSGIANASEEQITKLKSGIELFLEKTPNLTGDIKKQLEDYIKTLSSGASVSKEKYKSMVADLKKFQSAQTSTRTIWEQMVGKMREGIAFLATKFSFYQIFNQFRQGFEVIHQFDDALTEMMKVSDETRLSLERYQKTTFDTADAIGTNALQLQNSTADFMRLGETLDQAAESAKTANVLMNVSEFQSIDEATKSLIALSAAYDDLSKTQIIDKLNEVGNNFSISTSGAAEALQASASALKTAGNDMDEALALVTAGNQVVQDISKAGNGLRTISLRLTGTKSAKEELEELGEDTDSLITTQSKLRDTIKQATAVASNGFKGFDILDDNGNYKSTYEIMLGIAQIYQEILDTDKQFGTNNANLLLETVAGKTRANIAASIFQSPDVLEAAYKSSQDANGSAMRENEKYIQSISGHLAQLQNAWQEMWANAANREVINFFIDAAKAVVNLANAVGVLPTTLALLVPYINIITKAKSGKGIITQFLEWAAALDTAKETVKNTSNVGTVVEETVDIIEESAQRASEAREVYNDAIEDMLDTDMDSKASNEMPMPSYLARHLEEEEKWSWDSLEDKSSIESSAAAAAANEAEAESLEHVAEASASAAASQEANVITDTEEIATSAGATVANEAEGESYTHVAEASLESAAGQEVDAAADLENAATSAGASVANTEQAIAQTGQQAANSSSGIGLLSKAFNGLLGAVGPIPLAIGAVGIAAFAAWKYYQHLRNEWFNGAKEATDNIKQQKEQIDSQIDSYKELKDQLDSGDLSEEETIETKQKILDIQKQISEQYGSAAKGVDLVNGKLEKQVDLLNNINQKEADKQYLKNSEGFRVAGEEYNKNRSYNVSLLSFKNSELRNAVNANLEKNGLSKKAVGTGTFTYNIETDASEGIKTLEEARDSLEELKKEFRDPEDVKAIESQISIIEASLSDAYDTIEEYEETYLQGLELQLARMTNQTGYNSYQNYQTAVSDLESAYSSGNTKKIQEARQAFEEANKAKNDFLKVGDNSKFLDLFNAIDDSFIKNKNQYYDTVNLLKNIIEPERENGLFVVDNEKDKNEAYTNNTKALKKYTKAEEKQLKAAKELYKLNPDRVDIEGTLLDNTYASGKFSNALNDLMRELGWSTDNADMLIDALVEAGIVQGTAGDIANYASESYTNFSSSINDAINNINALNTAMAESASGKGITDPNLEAFRKAFGEDGLKVLEKTANGYHLNVEGAHLLREQQDALVKSDYASALSEQYSALERLQEGYLKAREAGEDTSGYIQQKQAIQDNIDKINEQLMAYQNANSAYQTWLAKQSSEGEREMYNSVYSGYDAVKDELERGWAGEKTRSWLDLIFNDEGDEDFDAWLSSAEEVKEKFAEVTKDIEGTGGYSIADFFTVDANGKSTSQGIWNFFEAVQNKQKEVGKEFVNLEEGWFDFTQNGDYQIADLLGMDVESVQAILRAAADAGFEINLDQPLYSMETLEEKADSAKQSLEELTGKQLAIDLDPSSIEEADDAMGMLTTYQQSLMEDNTIEPKVKTKMLQDCASLMELIAAKKRELIEGDLMFFQLDSAELKESKENITDIFNRLYSYSNSKGNVKLNELFTIDPMRINDIDYLSQTLKKIQEVKANPELDSTQYDYFNELLIAIQQRIDLLNASDLSEDGSITIDQFMAAEGIVDRINQKMDYAAKHSKVQFNWEADTQSMEDLEALANLPEKAKIELNIPTDKTAEELLELAQKGELKIGVKTEGEVPKQGQQVVTTAKTVAENVVTNTTNNILNFEDRDKGARELAAQELSQFDGTTVTSGLDLNDEKFQQTKKEDEKELENLNKTKAKPSVELMGLGGVQSVASSMKSSIDSVKGKSVRIDIEANTHGVEYAKEQLQGLINKATEAARSAFTHLGNGANGTAHVQGTAFSRGSITFGNAYAGGKWGLPKNQTALTGELGTEIVVRDGNWFTVGDDGAEFVNLKKGDIVFNHKQAQELLENGYVTSNKGRGHLVGFANGTAYSSGSSGGAIKPSTSSKGMGGSTKSSSSGGGSSSSGRGNSGSNNKSSNNNAKETKNTLDEVEILIARIERQIANLDKTISNTYTNWSIRNKGISENLKKVATEIKDQNKAYTVYAKKAASVGLSKAWQDKIKNGAFRIEDVKDDKLWEKISKFKEYWEKALAAKDAVIDLKQKEGELYKQRFDNEQTYYEELIANLQHTIDVMGAYNDQLEEGGKLSSKNLIINQITTEQQRLKKLEDEYKNLIYWRDASVKNGKIKKGSEAWEEMQQTINEVSESIIEANTNLITFSNEMRDIDWNRWEKIHDAIAGVNNELEFFYGLINEDDMFDEQGTITDYGTTAFGILAQEYDAYFREVEQYQKEIEQVEKDLASDKYNQTLVDKLKDLKEAQQDAASNAKKMKDSMVDVTEQGIKKQIDYVKKLIDDYEDLLETQKDQIDYAKKVTDQQKELNKLEKQYRAIQNDTSEENATKRQRLREQINEKRQELQDTQEDRRLSETKDMLSDFEETFEEFLENKLKDVEGIVHQVIDRTNANGSIIKDTIESLSKSYGYTPSDTLQNTLNNLSNNLASYFDSMFDNDKVNSIVHGVDAIVDYYDKAQAASESGSNQKIMSEKIKTSGSNIQKYTDSNGNERIGYFNDNGTRNTTYTGWAESGGKYYRFENGDKVEGGQFINADGKKYYLVKGGSRYTGLGTIDGKKYYFNTLGEMQTGWQTIDGKKYYFDKNGMAYTGIKNIGNKTFYFDKNGVLQMGKWQTVGNKKYYLSAKDGHALKGKQTINKVKYTFNSDGSLKKKGWKKGTASVPSTGMAWTNEGRKAEAIIRKSDGAILTPLNKGDSVIPNSAMKNMYQALTNPAKYLKQYTTPDVKVIQSNNNSNNQPPVVNMQFIANGVQDANRFVNDLMNNKKLEKWVQEVTLGQANGNNNYKKYSYVIH